MDSLIAYIKEGAAKQKEYHLYGHIPVFIKDDHLSDDVDIEELITELESRIPIAFVKNIEVVYIGEFAELEGRNAIYLDGAIYVSSAEPTTEDMMEDMIHEIAHSVETSQGAYIYGDNYLRQEFLEKRLKLKSILDAHGYQIPEKYYLNTEYSQSFDEFLSDGVGYPTLLNLTMGLFVSPYGATSLQEYFANGFEKYYLGLGRRVKEISPTLYNIITNLNTESDNA
jgi:hypothetical protein